MIKGFCLCLIVICLVSIIGLDGADAPDVVKLKSYGHLFKYYRAGDLNANGWSNAGPADPTGRSDKLMFFGLSGQETSSAVISNTVGNISAKLGGAVYLAPTNHWDYGNKRLNAGTQVFLTPGGTGYSKEAKNDGHDLFTLFMLFKYEGGNTILSGPNVFYDGFKHRYDNGLVRFAASYYNYNEIELEKNKLYVMAIKQENSPKVTTLFLNNSQEMVGIYPDSVGFHTAYGIGGPRGGDATLLRGSVLAFASFSNEFPAFTIKEIGNYLYEISMPKIERVVACSNENSLLDFNSDTLISIYGKNFGTAQRENIITIDGKETAKSLFWNRTNVIVRIPAGTLPGLVELSVTVDGFDSAPYEMKLLDNRRFLELEKSEKAKVEKSEKFFPLAIVPDKVGFDRSYYVTENSSEGNETRIEIFDTRGQPIRLLFDKELFLTDTVNWDGKDNNGDLVPYGNYLIKISYPNKNVFCKVTVLPGN